MIILRYLTREILLSTLTITFVLMTVIMAGRFVKYLADAAAGKFESSVLLAIILYRVPGFIELILPLGFMLAILMAFGRLYAEQEMTILFSSGISQRKILFYTFIPALLVAIMVGLCSLWLSPLGLKQAAKIIEQQKQRSDRYKQRRMELQGEINAAVFDLTDKQWEKLEREWQKFVKKGK